MGSWFYVIHIFFCRVVFDDLQFYFILAIMFDIWMKLRQCNTRIYLHQNSAWNSDTNGLIDVFWIVDYFSFFLIWLVSHALVHASEKLLVFLRDGRKLMGLLRSFDQFGNFSSFSTCYSVISDIWKQYFLSCTANAVLEGACERVIVGDFYCDIHLGLYVIRGENVVLIGELVWCDWFLTIQCFLHTLMNSSNIYLLLCQDLEREELPPHMARVSEAEIRRVSCPQICIFVKKLISKIEWSCEAQITHPFDKIGLNALFRWVSWYYIDESACYTR